MTSYRVFVMRYYIAVEYYDIEADTARNAEKVAVAAAKALLPDVRADAVDNGWRLENPAGCAQVIPYLGSSSAVAQADANEHMQAVFKDKRGRGIAYKYK